MIISACYTLKCSTPLKRAKMFNALLELRTSSSSSTGGSACLLVGNSINMRAYHIIWIASKLHSLAVTGPTGGDTQFSTTPWVPRHLARLESP